MMTQTLQTQFARTFRGNKLPCIFGFLLIIVLVFCVLAERVQKNLPNRAVVTNAENERHGEHPSILCLIVTTASRTNRTYAVNQTWAKRCDKHLFVMGESETETVRHDVMYLPVREKHRHLTIKVRQAIRYAYTLYKDTYDWYVKCDDDSYIIMENLRRLVSGIDPKTPAYLGLAMNRRKHPHNGFISGVCIVMSSEAVRRLVMYGLSTNSCKADGRSDDVSISCSMARSDVPILNTLDHQRRETFHHVALERYLYPPHEKQIYALSWHKVLKSGSECCSKYTICFHKLSPEQQFLYDQLLYNTTVVGIKEEEPAKIYDPYVLSSSYWKEFAKRRHLAAILNEQI